MSGSPPEIAVTGIGLATALGPGRESTWQALRAGRRGARALGRVAAAGFPLAQGVLSPGCLEPVLDLACHVAREALADAALPKGPVGSTWPCRPERVAVLVGLSKGGLRGLDRAARGQAPSDPHTPFLEAWPSAAAARLSAFLGAGGPCTAPIAACATGMVAVLQAAALLRRGDCDLALAGGADASLDPLILAGFRSMRVLARVEGDPLNAVRPWDRRRSGFLVGEGAAVLVLERAADARARGVRPYALLAGGALGSDAHHITGLADDPAALVAVIQRCLASAQLQPADIDHVNVHGTATPTNDPLECRALRAALGPAADQVSCTASKAQIGHLLGASGAVEFGLACLALRDQFVPPTRNLLDQDPACDLDATPEVGRSRPIRAALKLSLGFGGHLAVAALRTPEGSPREAPSHG